MNLTVRLLSACRQSYLITASSPVAPVSPVGPVPGTYSAGWTVPPQAVVAGDAGQDAAMVGAMAEGVVVAIRGTEPTCPDWLDDFMAALVQAEGFPGRVHDGFRGAVERLWPGVKALVDGLPHDLPLVVTGHSKGGSCAVLLAWLLHQAYPGRGIIVRTFAAARVADPAFAAAYDAAIPDHVRYEYDTDIVPHVPISGPLAVAVADCLLLGSLISAEVDYGAVGVLAYIDGSGALHPDSAALETERIAALAVTLWRPDAFAQIAACHSLDRPTSGYVRAAYPA